jgi:hypothetical protein
VIELLFDGARDLSTAMVTFFAKTNRDIAAKAMETLDRDPDPKWAQGLAGVYDNASLGDLRISPAEKGGGGIYDVGEWKSAFARKTEDDGTVKLVLVDPPFAGGETTVGGDAAHPTLTIEYGQARYVFERVVEKTQTVEIAR